MKDFEKLINECEADLRSIGIKIGNVKKYSINTRAKSRWGQCKQIGENSFEINISCRLLADDISDQAVKDTILHEMLHTVEGCMCHTGKWKELAQKVNRQLPQYNIKRLTSSEEKGIVPDNGIKAEASGKTSKKQPSVGKVTAKPTGKTARKTTKKAPEKPTRKGSGSLFFLLSLVLLVVYIIIHSTRQ